MNHELTASNLEAAFGLWCELPEWVRGLIALQPIHDNENQLAYIKLVYTSEAQRYNAADRKHANWLFRVCLWEWFGEFIGNKQRAASLMGYTGSTYFRRIRLELEGMGYWPLSKREQDVIVCLAAQDVERFVKLGAMLDSMGII